MKSSEPVAASLQIVPPGSLGGYPAIAASGIVLVEDTGDSALNTALARAIAAHHGPDPTRDP